jgi:heptosyltransferase-2
VKREHTGNSITCRSNRSGVLVLAPNWLGDAVMATPFLFALRSRLRDRDINLLCRSYVSAVYRRCSAVDHLVEYEKTDGISGALGAIRKDIPSDGRDICFVLPRSFSSAMVAFLSGAGRRIGYGGDLRGLFLTDTLPKDSYTENHLIDIYLRLVESIGGAEHADSRMPVVVPQYTWQERIEELGLEEDYVVISPGAEYGPAKIWPHERYTALVSRIAAETGRRIVVIGSEGDRPFGARIIEEAGIEGYNLAGMGDVEDLLCVLRGSSLVIGNDSGPVHLSAAMGRPTVTIFGSTSPEWTAPKGRSTAIVRTGLDCSPCFERGCPHGEARCMLDIDPELVFDTAHRLLQEEFSGDD